MISKNKKKRGFKKILRKTERKKILGGYNLLQLFIINDHTQLVKSRTNQLLPTRWPNNKKNKFFYHRTRILSHLKNKNPWSWSYFIDFLLASKWITIQDHSIYSSHNFHSAGTRGTTFLGVKPPVAGRLRAKINF